MHGLQMMMLLMMMMGKKDRSGGDEYASMLSKQILEAIPKMR